MANELEKFFHKLQDSIATCLSPYAANIFAETNKLYPPKGIQDQTTFNKTF